MRALELTGFDGPVSLRLAERPEPRPGRGEVRVRLRAMALNHLDVFVSRGLPRRPLPAILGSDGVGTVDAVGEGVDPGLAGREVLLFPVLSCGKCDACARGEQVLCDRFVILGEHIDGTFQDALVVSESQLCARPAHLTLEEAAALPLSWLTAWRLLFTRGRLVSGDTLVIVGIGGGVATAALLLARAHGLRVLVTSRDEAKRQRAKALGASEAFPSESFGNAVRELTRGGARAVLDTAGAPTFDESIRALAKEGLYLTVGATSGPKVELNMPRLFFRHLSIVTSTMGNRSEFEAMLADVQRYGLRPPVDRSFPLERGADAFAHLESGAQFGKVVLTS